MSLLPFYKGGRPKSMNNSTYLTFSKQIIENTLENDSKKRYNTNESGEIMKFVFDDTLDVSEIVVAIKVPAGHGQAVHKDRASHGFAMHLDGDKDYVFGSGKILKVQKNDIIYMPKGSDYFVQTWEIGDCYAINFQLSQELKNEPFVFSPKNPNAFAEAFRSAEKAWRTKKEGYVFRCKSQLYGIFSEMRGESLSGYHPSMKTEIIRPAIEMISENYASGNLSVPELAKLCNVSEVYFRKVFSTVFGLSPIKYINDLKIARAKELLLTQMYSVAEVSEMSGFSDISYFSREFKKAVGVSPSEYEG